MRRAFRLAASSVPEIEIAQHLAVGDSEGCSGIPKQPLGRHSTETIPDSSCDDSAQADHPSHFAHRLFCIGHEMKNQHRKSPIETFVRERQAGRSAGFEIYPLIAN